MNKEEIKVKNPDKLATQKQKNYIRNLIISLLNKTDFNESKKFLDVVFILTYNMGEAEKAISLLMSMTDISKDIIKFTSRTNVKIYECLNQTFDSKIFIKYTDVIKYTDMINFDMPVGED